MCVELVQTKTKMKKQQNVTFVWLRSLGVSGLVVSLSLRCCIFASRTVPVSLRFKRPRERVSECLSACCSLAAQTSNRGQHEKRGQSESDRARKRRA